MALFHWQNWVDWALKVSTSRLRKHSRRGRYRPRLEFLEDRLAPANLPDLVILGTPVVPGSAIVGNNQKVNVDFSVRNQGDAAASRSWTDAIYLSDDNQYDTLDRLLADSKPPDVPLAAGVTYTINRSFTVPNSPAGNKFLLFRTDREANVDEADESNNVTAVPITLDAPDIDLVISNVTAPTALVAGNKERITVTYTVTNHGTVAAATDWHDGFLISADNQLSTIDDNFVHNDFGQPPLLPGESYTLTRTLFVPRVDLLGNRFLLIATDVDDVQSETDSTNNVFFQNVTVTPPDVDLVVTSAAAPASGVAGNGDTVSVTWTVENQGTVEARAIGNDYVYLSSDQTVDHFSDRQVFISFKPEQTVLPANGTYTLTESFAVPNVAAGDYFLLFGVFNQGESNSDNNVRALAFQVIAPGEVDLDVTTATAPSTAEAFTSIDVSYTVKNQGTATAGASWDDQVYLSEDAVLSSDDWGGLIFNQPCDVFDESRPTMLTGGESYTRKTSVRLPNVLAGNYFLLFMADASRPPSTGGSGQSGGKPCNDEQREINEINNIDIIPITITAPPDIDFVVTAATGPSSVVAGNNATFTVNYTVQNQGIDVARREWVDQLYLSDDRYFDFSDQSLYPSVFSQKLGAGSSYSEKFVSTLPDVEAGDRFLLAVVDAYQSQAETREANNVFVLPITIIRPNVRPNVDLVVESATAPASAVLGAEVPVTYTVKNQGTEAASIVWNDAIYIEPISGGSFSGGSGSGGGSSGGSGGSLPLPSLAPGASYTRTRNIVLPTTDLGSRALLFVVDQDSRQAETSETNNTFAVQITLTAPDLVVTAASAPASAMAGESIAITFAVQNQASEVALRDWFDHVYVSNDQLLDDFFDQLATSINAADHSPMAGGAGYTRNQNVTLPAASAPGNRFLLFVADGDKKQGEVSDANNTYVVPITISAPDLVVTSATAPSAVAAGEALQVSLTVQNQGSVPSLADWEDRVYISDDTIFDRFTDQLLTSIDAAGRSPLAPGDSYAVNATITRGDYAPGNRFLLFVTDGDRDQGETNEHNNVRAVAITASAPDLTLTTASAPASAVLGDTIAVSFAVQNLGGVIAAADWKDAVYYSLDAEYDDRVDILLSTFDASARSPLDGSGSYTQNVNVTLRIPVGPPLAPGNRFLLFRTDYLSTQGETNENNNYFAVPISLTAPDLVVTTATAPPSAVINDAIAVSFTVRNEGSVPAPADWSDWVYISNDDQFDFLDIPLQFFSAANRSPLAAGASYTQNVNVFLRSFIAGTPEPLPGDRFLLFSTDALVEQLETNENNNYFAVPITLTTAAPLAATGVPLAAKVGVRFTGTVATFTHAGRPVVPGNYAVTIDWGDITTRTSGTVPVSGDGYQVSGTHTYRREGNFRVSIEVRPVQGGAATATSTAAVTFNTQSDNARLVSALYEDILGHTVDSGSLGFFTQILDEARAPTMTQVALDYVASPENRFSVVQGYYTRYLGRVGSVDEINFWVGVRQQGGTQDDLLGPIVASDEFFGRSGGTNDGWLDRVYLLVLGRQRNASETFFLDVLEAGGTRLQAVRAILSSTEYQDRLIRSAYAVLLVRQVGATSDFDFWRLVLAQPPQPGQPSPEDQFLGAILASPEYFLKNGNAAQTWVISLYANLLHREPDQGGLDFTINRVLSGYAQRRTEVAMVLATSPEYRTGHLVPDTYATHLRREASSADTDFWLHVLEAGASDEQVLAAIVSSDEYFALAGGTNAAYVDRLYEDLLGRTRSDGDFFFVAALDGGASRTQVALDILGGAEYRRHLIRGFYAKFLGRQASDDDLSFWSSVLEHGAKDEQVLAAIVGSAEYFGRQT